MAIFTTLLLLAAVFIVSELLRPKPKFENARPSGLGDFRFPTATKQRVVPIVFGTVKLEGPNVVWYGDLQQDAITEKVKMGLFSSTRFTKGYRYNVGVQFGLCRGSADLRLLRIQVKEKEVFSGSLGQATTTLNFPELFGGDDLGLGGLIGDVDFYTGTNTQPVNDYLAKFQDSGAGTDRTPAYIGTSYAVFREANVAAAQARGGYIGNSTSVDPWKFEVRRIANPLALAGGGSVNGGNDMNPISVLYELFTDTEWGYAFPPALIDSANWIAAANTLATEGNGFSMQVDSRIEGVEFQQEVERQIDGVIFLDHQAGLFRIKLARDDYTLASIPKLLDGEEIEVANFSRGSWEDTTNVINLAFNNRADDYADDYALAQDQANMLIQGGGTVLTGRVVAAEVNYPGVKDAALANSLAWRELATLTYPLVKATVIVDRSFWNIRPFDVIAWTNVARGFIDLPMRVQRIDFGEARKNEIKLDLIQDIFRAQGGLIANPPPTGWIPPEDNLDPFDDAIAFEAPRGFVTRDPNFSSLGSKIWSCARRKGAEVGWKISERNAAGSPTGSFIEDGEVLQFAKLGELKSALASGSGVPTGSILVTPDPDAQSVIEALFIDNPDIVDQGTNLLNLVYVGDSASGEFMLVRSAATSGGDVNLQNVYRGVLDGGQFNHAAQADVWVLINAGGIQDGVLPPTDNVEVKLLPFSLFDQVVASAVTSIDFTNDRRVQRPYPPSRVSLNNSGFPSSASLDFVAGGPEATGIDTDFIRRDYRVGDGADEIPPLTTDAQTLDPTFPAANNTTTEVTVIDDPDGTPTTLFTETGIAGTQIDILRLKILQATDGVVPSRMRFELRARHDDGAQTGLLSRNALTFDFNTTSALSALFNFGALDTDDVSNLYLNATVAGQYDFTLSSSIGGDVEYRLNGGSWIQLIASGNTTGNIPAVAVNDDIEIRHRDSTGGVLVQIDMDAPGAGLDAYGVLFT